MPVRAVESTDDGNGCTQALALSKALHEARKQGVEIEIQTEELSIGHGKTARQVMAYLLSAGECAARLRRADG